MHIALTMVALNDLEVNTADVLNVYVMAPNRKDVDSIRPRVWGVMMEILP